MGGAEKSYNEVTQAQEDKGHIVQYDILGLDLVFIWSTFMIHENRKWPLGSRML